MIKLNFRLLLWILIIFNTITVYGRDDSWKFRKRNHKLNQNYVKDLNKKSAPVFILNNPAAKNTFSSGKGELSIFIHAPKENYRFTNPDAIHVHYHYQQFNMGDLIPKIFKPLEYEPGRFIQLKNPGVRFFPR
jgi:hypothetical protein